MSFWRGWSACCSDTSISRIRQVSGGAARNSHDTAKADVTRRRIDRLCMTRCRAIAAAIVWCTQERAAFQNLSWNPHLRLAGVVARTLRATAWVAWNAARLASVGGMSRREPVVGPFPHVADHVVEAITIRRECSHWRGARIAIRGQV